MKEVIWCEAYFIRECLSSAGFSTPVQQNKSVDKRPTFMWKAWPIFLYIYKCVVGLHLLGNKIVSVLKSSEVLVPDTRLYFKSGRFCTGILWGNLCSHEKGTNKYLGVYCTSLLSGRKLSPLFNLEKIRSRGRRCLPRYCIVPVHKNLALPSLSVKVTKLGSISRSTELFSQAEKNIV